MILLSHDICEHLLVSIFSKSFFLHESERILIAHDGMK